MAKGAVENLSPEGLEELLSYLKENRGFDFTGYKRSTLGRRIRKRMDEVGVESFSDYQDHLEVTPAEFTDLFNTILINVTSFFRDASAWDCVATEVIPSLLETKADSGTIRVWSAACSSGEETYSAAILLAEAMGDEAFRARVKIYATDVDEQALNRARHATFPRQAVEPVADDLLEKYFELNTAGYQFRPDLRRSVIFGRNDLVQDAPISHIDLLLCRNALMYFTREAQSGIVAHFNYALTDEGFLFLGKSEMLTAHEDLFTPFSLKSRVFKKVPGHGLRERLPVMADTLGAPALDGAPEIRELAADAAPVAQVVVDSDGFVVVINEEARRLFRLAPDDLGRLFQDLELSYRPLDLRSALERAYAEGGTIDGGRIVWQLPSGKNGIFGVNLAPVLDGAGTVLGASITFEDVTELAELDQQHQHSKHRLETAYEELQSTVEELETTNEELQSTNEELETTNEELQSTNEELETTNEELQSTNDELETMNDEQNLRTKELDRVNLFLEAILGNLGVGVVVLDRDQRIQVWNASSKDLWGLGPEETEGKQFSSLDIGLPVSELSAQVTAALADQPQRSEVVLDAVKRNGRKFKCFVRAMPLSASDGRNHGAILLMGEIDSEQSAAHR